ncbi:MAG TPA: glycosyltransferase family 1 protein [Pricia antarctica]|uniref:Glycosyltransferase family 1 protein n=2 Tax=root TaxID=1 RepID=A0A831QL13_9FLAO|nr:glycosyltransferase family 1 protein [Pricia antarctica]
MNIGFDAKRIFHNSTGLGNYGRDAIRILHRYTPIDKFILYNTATSNVDRLDILQRIYIKYPKGWFWKKFSSLWRLGPVSNQIIKDKVDIFHGLTGELPAGLEKTNIATVVTIHDLIFLTHPKYYSFFDRIIYTRKFKYAAANTDRIIAISEQTKRDAVQYLNADPEKITVVYQGCNDAYKKEYSADFKNEVRQKYGLPEEFVLNVGTLQERKNALTLVKAIHGMNHHLVLVGSEKKYAQKIHAYIAENKLESQIIFLKNVGDTELAAIYQMATIFCYPSICEGFGIPIIEALFSKTAVITSKGSCFPEAGGLHSVYIEPLDVNMLRNEIVRLFEHPELRKEIEEKGYQFVQKFSDEAVANQLFEVYKSLLT